MKDLKHYLPESFFAEEEYDPNWDMDPEEEQGNNIDNSNEMENIRSAIAELASLPQPITINGGSYAYSCDVTKDPLAWSASDGSPVHPKSFRDIGKWFDGYVRKDWNDFIDGGIDATELSNMGILARGQYRDQGDFEHRQSMGESVNESINRMKKLAGLK